MWAGYWEKSECLTYSTHLLAVNINLALENKQLCLYVTVNVVDTSNLSKISSGIKDYEEHINKRNLFIVNLKPFYDSALAGDTIRGVQTTVTTRTRRQR